MSCDESSADHSVTRLIERLKVADPQAAQTIWRRYFERLLPLARARLRRRPDSAVDEEDVLVSVFDRFFRAVAEDRFARLHDRDDLWQILLMLTERQAANQLRRAAAAKRGGKLPPQPGAGGHTPDQVHISDPTPGPEFAAAFNDSLACAINRLTDTKTREVALLRMEGYENQQIAASLEISLSSVERKLRVVREVWAEEFEN
jgi:DNA-directed RNA polymerase specialized sigma24 family protein